MLEHLMASMSTLVEKNENDKYVTLSELSREPEGISRTLLEGIISMYTLLYCMHDNLMREFESYHTARTCGINLISDSAGHL